jgi:acyl carrier protein
MQEFEKFVEILDNYIEIDGITPDHTFSGDLEINSFDTLCIVTDVKSVFGVRLKLSDFIDYKTVGQMAEYIASVRTK